MQDKHFEAAVVKMLIMILIKENSHFEHETNKGEFVVVSCGGSLLLN